LARQFLTTIAVLTFVNGVAVTVRFFLPGRASGIVASVTGFAFITALVVAVVRYRRAGREA
jgi:hypothetical protein